MNHRRKLLDDATKGETGGCKVSPGIHLIQNACDPVLCAPPIVNSNKSLPMPSAKNLNKADFIGIVSSSVCLVHCILTPLLLATGASFFASSFFNFPFLILSFASVYKATEFDTHTGIALLLWTSFWGFLFSTLFREDYHWLHYSGHLFAVLLIAGHILNIRQCRKCSEK